MNETINISLAELFNEYSKYQNKLNGEDEFSLYKNFTSFIPKDAVHRWINKVFTKNSIKNNEIAKHFREKGNKLYIKKLHKEAIFAYSKSIIHAEETSEELALAFANRSAIHFSQKCYQSCLKDIKNCKNVGTYPQKLKSKLILREARCQQKLNLIEKCDQTLQDLTTQIKKESLQLDKESIDKLANEIKNIQLEPSNDKDYNKEIDLGMEYGIPHIIDGPNSSFLYASSSVKLVYTEEQGRHVVASKNFELGDVLFVEKPYALVPTYCENPNYTDRCYFCYKRTNSAVPCAACDIIYCDKTCEESAYLSYHKYECPGSCVNAWQQLGVSYLALRLALHGINYLENSPTIPANQVSKFGSQEEDNYPYIWSMVTNLDKISGENKIINLTMALSLCEYLRLKTSLFADMSQRFNLSRDELQLRMGGIILRHLLQVTCNASMVEDFYENIGDVFENNSSTGNEYHTYVRAAGMYPTHSMLNHSCDPNITLYFCNNLMIVKARRPIQTGEEICNSYGYSCYKESTLYRQAELLKQYCFTCKCSACTYPTKPEIFTECLLCTKCKNCSLPDKVSKNKYKCTKCEHIFDPKECHLRLEEAEDLLKDDQTYAEFGKSIKCLEIRRKYVPEVSELIREILQMITEDNLIGFEKWWHYTKQLIKVECEILPYHSITYANNVKYTIQILVSYLEQESVEYFPGIEEVVKSTDDMVNDIKKLYLVFNPPEIINFETIDSLLNKVVIMIQTIKQ